MNDNLKAYFGKGVVGQIWELFEGKCLINMEFVAHSEYMYVMRKIFGYRAIEDLNFEKITEF